MPSALSVFYCYGDLRFALCDRSQIVYPCGTKCSFTVATSGSAPSAVMERFSA